MPIEALSLRPNPVVVFVHFSRVEDGRGGCALRSLLRFPSPLIKPDVQISRIRLSDWPSPYDPRRASIARAHKMQNRKFSKHLAKGEP